METLTKTTNFPFMRYRFPAVALSLVLVAASVWVWFTSGLDKYGVDFVGGIDVVVSFEEPVTIGEVRDAVTSAGITGAIVQRFEQHSQDFSIRVKAESQEEVIGVIRVALQDATGKKFSFLKQDYVGPIIGEQIRRDGLAALTLSLIAILIYISIRFEFRFAVGAIAALVHDVIVTTGIYIFCGYELSAGMLAALLTIVGYSLNDTIIIYDRIRENLGVVVRKAGGVGKVKRDSFDFLTLVNDSVNQTLSRTIITAVTTFFVVAALWLLGGGAVADLAFAFVIGVVVGTYSTIFVACPTVLALEK